MKHSRTWISGIVLLGMMCGGAHGATPAAVDAALDKGKAWLLSQQKNGNWEATTAAESAVLEPNGGQWGGVTAIATYALLCAGEKESSPTVSAAVKVLMAHKAQGVYASASRCLVWSRLQLKPEVRAAGSQDVKFLLSAVKSQGAGRGLLFYVPALNSADGQYDHSTSQFAVLGLSALEPLGFEIPTEFWAMTDKAWRNHQNSDGSWSYIKDGGPQWGIPSDSMTLAAIATLSITRAHLRQGGACHGNDPDPNVENAMAWIARQGGDALVGLQRGYPFQNYTQFTASRVGVATGHKYFGNIDWYTRGSDFLVASQHPDGSWAGYGPAPAETALAILGLTYGSAPVIINKLEYSVRGEPGKEQIGHWNQRPQDISNFTDWMGRGLERRLGWQTVNLASATLDDLHEAPVLYIGGNQALDFSPVDCAKLRLFVEQGGMILGNADCDSANFTRGFEQLGETLFPAYEFRQLPLTHPIFTHEQFHKWEKPPIVRGLSNGVREFMLLPNHDISRALQSRSTTVRVSDYQLLDDIVLYTMDSHGLQEKGITYLVADNPSVSTERQVKIARLQYAGNWDPEPSGWQRLAAVLHNDQKIALQVETVKLGAGKPTAPIAHFTGTGPVILTDSQRQDLKEYVNAGSTLVIDAAGGDVAFAASMQTELGKIFGSDPASQLNQPLPPSHPLYSAGGKPIETFHYRTFARERLGSAGGPQLRGITLNGRLAVIFSREDLSAGLVGEQMDGIVGYTPETATDIMRNIVLAVSSQPR